MFDPYHKWLGIPKDQRPPTHYQLLGVSPEEQDLEVIEEAAIRQTTHIRAYQIGPHAPECTRILNEIAKARLTLLNAAKRKEYDEHLAKAKGPVAAAAPHVDTRITAEAEAPNPFAISEEEVNRPRADDAKTPRKPKHAHKDLDHIKKPTVPTGVLIGVGAGVGALLLVALIGVGATIYFSRGGPPKKHDDPIVQNDPKEKKKPNAIDDADKDKKVGVPPPEKKQGEKIDNPPQQGIPEIKAAPPFPVAEGFVPLFNTKNLAGWKSNRQPPGGWRVENGILTGAEPNAGELYTARDDYGDFHLRMEARISDEGNSFVLFRYPHSLDQLEKRKIGGYALRVSNSAKDMLKTGSLSVYENQGLRNMLFKEQLAPPGQWFNLEVLAQGNLVEIKVNGRTVRRFLNPRTDLMGGRIVLGFSDPARQTVMEYRKIEIKEFKAVAAAPPAPVQLGAFVPLFNGKDLDGWKSHPNWRVANGILTGSGPGLNILQTTRDDYKDFHLRMDLRINDAKLDASGVLWRSSGVYGYETVMIAGKLVGGVNVRSKNSVRFSSTPAPANVLSGEWFTLEIIAAGNRLNVKVNGATTTDFVDDKREFTSGQIALRQAPKSEVEVRKIEIKELAGQVPSTALVNRNSGKALGVIGGSKTNGAPIVQWDIVKDAPDQQWMMVAADKEWFNLVNVGSGTVLSILKNVATPNPPLLIYQKKDNDLTQQWKLVPDTNDAGWVKIVNRASGKVISASPKGNAVFLKDDVGGAEQIWKLDNPDLAKQVPVKTKDAPPPVKAARVAVPDADKVTQAEKAIREQFSKDYAKKAPADLIALAERLLLLAKETSDDAAACYALLSEARSLATKAGKADLAMKAATELIGKYEVDETNTKVETLLIFAKTPHNTESSKQFVEVALRHAGDAMMDDHFDTSLKILKAAAEVARRLKNNILLGQIQKQEKLVESIAKEYAAMQKARETLQANAQDVEANLVVGAYLAFRKGDWDKGLPHLALSGDTELQVLAKIEAAPPQDDKSRIELGDAWWTLAAKRPTQQKNALQWRAAFWYRQAVPNVKGLTLTKLADRVKLVDDQPAPFRIAGALKEVDRYQGHKGPVTCLALSKDGKRVFSCGLDGTFREWNFTTGKPKVLLGPQITKAPLAYFALSPDERHVAFLNSTGKMLVIDLGTFSPPRFAKNDQREAAPGFFWASDTNISYVAKTDWATWEPSRGSGSAGSLSFGFPAGGRATGRAVFLSPDRDYAAATTQEGAVLLFKLSGVGGRNSPGNIDADATTAAFSKDSRFIVLGAKDGSLRVYNTRTGAITNVVQSLKGHNGAARCVAYAPNGQQIVSGGDDRTVRVWDAASGKELQRFPHTGAVTSLVVTPDNRYVISACADAVIRMWSLPK